MLPKSTSTLLPTPPEQTQAEDYLFGKGYLWLAVCILAQATANSCSKMAGLTSSPDSLSSLVLTPWYWASLGAMAFQALCWVQTLKNCELSMAYPMTALVLAANFACAAWIFEEKVTPFHILGIACIMAGVAMVSREST